MSILTLTTDWGLTDHYLAAFKGDLLSVIPELQLVDVSHSVEKYNIMQGAYILKSCYHHFPKGTIHFIGLNLATDDKIQFPYLALYSNEHYFLGRDSAIFSLILGNSEKQIRRLTIDRKSTFVEKTKVQIEAIERISRGKFNEIGTEETRLTQSMFPSPSINTDRISGTVVHIDSYGNILSNVHRDDFIAVRKDRRYRIIFRRQNLEITKIGFDYDSEVTGEVVILFNSDGFLQISINGDSAANMFNFKLMDTIPIEFE